MSALHYITFSGAGFEETTSKIVIDGPRYGAEVVRVYDDQWLMGTGLYKHNPHMWEGPERRGFGWHCWKPFVALDALERCNVGDVVLYTDGDTYPIHDLSAIKRVAERDGAMFFASSGHRNGTWCRFECHFAMGAPVVVDMPHACARFFAVRKGPWKPKQLMMEWLTYCLNPRANTRGREILNVPELPGFLEHRTDQAILTLLCHRLGYYLHREACDSGEGHPEDRDLYPQLFVQKHMGGNHHPTSGTSFRNVHDIKIHT